MKKTWYSSQKLDAINSILKYILKLRDLAKFLHAVLLGYEKTYFTRSLQKSKKEKIALGGKNSRLLI
jgi:hypothetical protein